MRIFKVARVCEKKLFIQYLKWHKKSNQMCMKIGEYFELTVLFNKIDSVLAESAKM